MVVGGQMLPKRPYGCYLVLSQAFLAISPQLAEPACGNDQKFLKEGSRGLGRGEKTFFKKLLPSPQAFQNFLFPTIKSSSNIYFIGAQKLLLEKATAFQPGDGFGHAFRY